MIFVNLLIVAAASGAQAYNWKISPESPQQCATASVTVTNVNDSVLPLDLLLIPYGPLPLPDASKTIYEIPLNGPNPYSIDFQLKYPAGTQLLYLVNAILLHGPLTRRSISPLFKQRVLGIYAIPVIQPILRDEHRCHFPLSLSFLSPALLIYLFYRSAMAGRDGGG